jgi:integrase
MPRQTARPTIAPGIRRVGDSLVAEIRIGNSRDGSQVRDEKKFPLGTDLAVMQAWQLHRRADGLLEAPTRAAAGTLAGDVPTFLATLPAGQYRVDSEQLLAHWSACDLGALPRHEIQRLDVISQIARWTEAGAAASTCNRRLSRLRKLYQALDGLTTPNPTDTVKFQRSPELEARDIPTRIVKLILDSIVDHGRAGRGETRPEKSLTKLRLTVIAWTGIPPATLRRVRPRDLDLPGARIYLQPRRKGKGAKGIWIALLPPAVEALRAFAAAKLFGLKWSNSSAGKTWRVGIARAIKTAGEIARTTGDQSWANELANLPPRCKPYDLRHSFASELYRLTGDIRAVSELLQHAELETTKRYTKGAVSARVTAAIATASAAYTTIPPAPAAVAPAPQPAPLRLVRRRS